LKREMREHITEDPVNFTWEGERHTKRTNVHEFEAKLRLIKLRMARRLEVTIKEG
jgi:hypothetical protein